MEASIKVESKDMNMEPGIIRELYLETLHCKCIQFRISIVTSAAAQPNAVRSKPIYATNTLAP
jgi:hypothetical protein